MVFVFLTPPQWKHQTCQVLPDTKKLRALLAITTNNAMTYYTRWLLSLHLHCSKQINASDSNTMIFSKHPHANHHDTAPIQINTNSCTFSSHVFSHSHHLTLFTTVATSDPFSPVVYTLQSEVRSRGVTKHSPTYTGSKQILYKNTFLSSHISFFKGGKNKRKNP